jgi:xylan 1,4-beta-xylosidase
LFSLTDRPGHLRLYGRETIGSVFRQSLVARRLQSHCASIETAVDFAPEHFQQMAGLVCYYNSLKLHYLYITRDDEHGRHLRVMSMLPDAVQGDAVTPPIGLPDSGIVQLRAEIDEERLRFAWKCGSGDWQWLPQLFDASTLSDEATQPGAPNFTGAFVGMCCQDVAGTLKHADFDYFIYRERPYRTDPKAS